MNRVTTGETQNNEFFAQNISSAHFDQEEFLDYEDRGDCYTWCYPIRFGEFDPRSIWRPSRIPSPSTNLTLYIHVPYCKFICKMCPFTHEPLQFADLDRYVASVCKEIEFYAKHPGSTTRTVTTLYFGGGTASTLTPFQIDILLKVVRENFKIAADCQITLECHPRTVDADYLNAIHKSGVNRVSFGVQSFEQKNIRSLKLHQNKTGE